MAGVDGGEGKPMRGEGPEILSAIQALARDMASVRLELDELKASRGPPGKPGTPVPTSSPDQNVAVTAGSAERAPPPVELQASDLPPVARASTTPAQEPTGWLPLQLPGEGVDGDLGENPYKRPPPGASYARPQLYNLYGDVGYDAMCRERMASVHEMRTLGPACFYLHNALSIMEEYSEEEEFPREAALATLREVLALLSQRHSFLVLDAVERKTNPGLMQYLKLATTGVGEGVPLASGNIRDFADRYMELTIAESARHAAKTAAERSHASDSSKTGAGNSRGGRRGGNKSQGGKSDSGSGSSAAGARSQS